MTGTRWASLLAKEVAGLRSAEHLPGFTYYEEAYPDWSAFTDYGDRWVEVELASGRQFIGRRYREGTTFTASASN